jgi:hypothetical protein
MFWHLNPQKGFFLLVCHFLLAMPMKKAVLSKLYVPLIKIQFMTLKQVTFSLPTFLSAADLKTAAFSVFLVHTPFGPPCAHISSPLL